MFIWTTLKAVGARSEPPGERAGCLSLEGAGAPRGLCTTRPPRGARGSAGPFRGGGRRAPARFWWPRRSSALWRRLRVVARAQRRARFGDARAWVAACAAWPAGAERALLRRGSACGTTAGGDEDSDYEDSDEERGPPLTLAQAADALARVVAARRPIWRCGRPSPTPDYSSSTSPPLIGRRPTRRQLRGPRVRPQRAVAPQGARRALAWLEVSCRLRLDTGFGDLRTSTMREW